MSAIDFDAIHWEVTAEGHLRPRTVPAPFKYPPELDVEDGVIYGYDDQFEGTLPTTGESPDAPFLDKLVPGDGQLIASIRLNQAEEPAYILYKTVTGAWTLPDEDLKATEDGDVVIPGLHNGLLYYVCAVSNVGLTYSLPSAILSGRPEATGIIKARYRVVGIKHMPGAPTKTLLVERIERPINP